MDGEPSNQAIVKALVIVHLDEFVKINAVEVKHKAKMVSPNEVIRQFNHTLQIVRVVLFQQQ